MHKNGLFYINTKTCYKVIKYWYTSQLLVTYTFTKEEEKKYLHYAEKISKTNKQTP